MLAVLRVRAWAQCVTCHWPHQPVSLCETLAVPRPGRGDRRGSMSDDDGVVGGLAARAAVEVS